MADLVEQVLQKEIEKQANYKTIEVIKDIDLEIDEGNLLAVDTNPFDLRKYKSKKDVCLKELARDNAQLLINRIFQLPTEKEDGVVVVKLPDTKVLIPRGKPVPKARNFTKWEEYAQMKGIQNRKRSKMVWDEQKNEWKPRWGYNRAADDTKDWCIEVPSNADPYEDQFEKRLKAKSERTAKNELHRLRNIARSQKTKVPGVGLTPTEAPSKDYVSKALAVAKRSTASIGKFTESLPKEKPSKYTGKKRKFEENYGSLKNETSKQLDILQKLKNKEPVIDVTKAVNTQLIEENNESSGKKPFKGKSKGFGGRKKGKGGAKGSFKGGKGSFKGGKSSFKGGKGGGGKRKR
ncbi:ribosome biogenesis regulatory protein homolog isoform X2 [Pecten maximus]|uniref:ribosome biogenesis regulatory protein homolog isoform X1 n=1 Tax=Pecten maximus TaxID=6579 RepID=UPI0014589819|nr:ribosome biogenesis regulatory protein homolog isoform X1 [Pecten maximus]XP_033739510.1 ribosome biogenesis regulatory protein homolog isoform X2 [Pecten maximus]